MQNRDTIAKHAHLMDTMAEKMGVDLHEQVLRGHVTPDEVVDAVLSCTNCTSPEACGQWLAETKGTQSQSPSYCRNSAMLRRLREI